MLTENELVQIATYIYEKQIQQITNGLSKVYTYAKKTATTKIPIIVAGLGKDFLAYKAAEQLEKIVVMDLGTLLPDKVSLAVPAVGVALMAAKQERKKADK
jgi:uncharacterized hydantoinase/oxoprolinase family protein